jgi:phosphate transport system substrate-binding protein
LVLCLVLGQAQAQAQEAAMIRGAGATFPADVYEAWAFAYSKAKQVPFAYAAVGSGEGPKRIIARQVDFGASDNPLAPTELTEKGLLQFPTLIGGLVPVVNLKGMKSGELRLTGTVLAKIFAGQITSWNDPAIVAINRTLVLPARTIKPIVREDASGSTKTFTAYLAQYDSAWEKRSGVATRVNWVGTPLAAKGTRGMTELLLATEGAIAYVFYQEVTQRDLVVAQLENRDGKFVLPSKASFQSAVAVSGMARSGQETTSLLNLSGADTWPLTETTYILIPQAMSDGARAKKVLNFFYWVFAQGDDMASDTGFVPLPTRVQVKSIRLFREVVGPDGKPVEYL